jgi:hypothetical protein
MAHRPFPCVFAAALTLAGVTALAQPTAASGAGSRADVNAQRSALEAGFEREKAECHQRFAVSDCLEDLRLRRHEALAPLVRRSNELSAQERHQRAIDQRARVQERELSVVQDESQRRKRMRASAAAASASAPASASNAPSRPRVPDDVEQARAATEQRATLQAARVRAEREQREAQAKAQRQQQQERLKRQEGKPVAQPLPAPAPLARPSAASGTAPGP